MDGTKPLTGLPPILPSLCSSSASSARGAFIVFEGADRAGKSTQCQLLVEHLQASGVSASQLHPQIPTATASISGTGMLSTLASSASQALQAPHCALQVPAELWRFPDRTTAIGKMINAYLTSQSEIDDAAVHLLFSANRWEKRCVRVRRLAQAKLA